jgi:hypothetical protein
VDRQPVRRLAATRHGVPPLLPRSGAGGPQPLPNRHLRQPIPSLHAAAGRLPRVHARNRRRCPVLLGRGAGLPAGDQRWTRPQHGRIRGRAGAASHQQDAAPGRDPRLVTVAVPDRRGGAVGAPVRCPPCLRGPRHLAAHTAGARRSLVAASARRAHAAARGLRVSRERQRGVGAAGGRPAHGRPRHGRGEVPLPAQRRRPRQLEPIDGRPGGGARGDATRRVYRRVRRDARRGERARDPDRRRPAARSGPVRCRDRRPRPRARAADGPSSGRAERRLHRPGAEGTDHRGDLALRRLLCRLPAQFPLPVRRVAQQAVRIHGGRTAGAVCRRGREPAGAGCRLRADVAARGSAGAGERARLGANARAYVERHHAYGRLSGELAEILLGDGP